MAVLIWSDDLNIGIDVIDAQHRRIVELANALEAAALRQDRAAAGAVMDELIDYTLSHFTFEEALMEDAGYEFDQAHRHLHEVFAARVESYRRRFRSGEEVALDLRSMLVRWLYQHIRHDDRAYADAVRARLMRAAPREGDDSWLSMALRRLFRR